MEKLKLIPEFVSRLKSPSFMGIKAGATVRFTLRDREYKAKVNPLLIFENHVMVNYGLCGTYVDSNNYVSHKG